jgi:hypothetical protein
MRLATHSQKLERWLGRDEVDQLAASMKDWYGPPVAVGNVPGKVYVTKGGDFRGHIEAGSEASIWDRANDNVRRWKSRADYSFEKFMRKQRMNPSLHGFTSLSDLIAEASAGKTRNFTFQKVGTTGVVAATNTLWAVGNSPSAGSNGAAAPGGTAYTDASTGALPFTNPSGGDTQHFVSGHAIGSVAGNQLLLYDRLFGVAKTMSSTGTESVTGVPTRYQSITPGDQDYAGGNFLFIECFGALNGTAHNWTTCLYTDSLGNSSTLPSIAGNSSNIINRLDMPASNWFCPLEAGDVGIKELDQMQCSASVTGTIGFTIGHPIAWFPIPLANFLIPVDGIQSAFQVERIFDDACLAFLEVGKSATTATTYSGTFKTVAG